MAESAGFERQTSLNGIINVGASRGMSESMACMHILLCVKRTNRRRAGISWPTGRNALWVRLCGFFFISHSFISFDIDIMTSIRSIFLSERNPPTSTAHRTILPWTGTARGSKAKPCDRRWRWWCTIYKQFCLFVVKRNWLWSYGLSLLPFWGFWVIQGRPICWKLL